MHNISHMDLMRKERAAAKQRRIEMRLDAIRQAFTVLAPWVFALAFWVIILSLFWGKP